MAEILTMFLHNCTRKQFFITFFLWRHGEVLCVFAHYVTWKNDAGRIFQSCLVLHLIFLKLFLTVVLLYINFKGRLCGGTCFLEKNTLVKQLSRNGKLAQLFSRKSAVVTFEFGMFYMEWPQCEHYTLFFCFCRRAIRIPFHAVPVQCDFTSCVDLFVLA